MKMTFRIECPLCKWGNQWNDGYINMGWIGLNCTHCEEKFFAKITINDRRSDFNSIAVRR